MQGLHDEGPKGLRIARLASRLAVTKGSFYWHFDGVVDFEERLLAHWQHWDTTESAREANREAIPLAALLEIIVDRDLLVFDDAVREWAQTNERAARAVAVNEKLRRRYVSRMLLARGLDHDKATLRAQMIVWTASRSSGESMAWRLEVLRELFRLAVADADATA